MYSLNTENKQRDIKWYIKPNFPYYVETCFIERRNSFFKSMNIWARLRKTIFSIRFAGNWMTFLIILKCSCICYFTLFLEQSMFFCFCYWCWCHLSLFHRGENWELRSTMILPKIINLKMTDLVKTKSSKITSLCYCSHHFNLVVTVNFRFVCSVSTPWSTLFLLFTTITKAAFPALHQYRSAWRFWQRS